MLFQSKTSDKSDIPVEIIIFFFFFATYFKNGISVNRSEERRVGKENRSQRLGD